MKNYGEEVHGIELDAETRCAHYRGARDIIAIRFKCCRQWFACFECHAELADHAPQRWPHNEFDARAILCGACGNRLTIREYLDCDSACPRCGRGFNPGCANHYHLYFEAV